MTDTKPGYNVSKTYAFYGKANFILRLALLTAVLWPLFAVITALLLTPHNAQTMVPLVSLSPLVPMFLFALGAPFRFFLLWHDPDAKAGFLWLVSLIAVELSVSIYFSIIPISNDPGLTPLLLLTASALVFLSIARIARWLRFMVVLVILSLTVIFLFGGRTKFVAAFTQGFQQGSSANQGAAKTTPVATGTSPQPQAASDAAPAPATPAPTAPAPATPAPTAPVAAQQELAIDDTASQPPPPRPLRPDWTQATTRASGPFETQFAPCILRAAILTCFFRIRNDGEDVDFTLEAHGYRDVIRAIDDLGNEYRPDSVQLGAKKGEYADSRLFSNVFVIGAITFTVSPDAKSLALLQLIGNYSPVSTGGYPKVCSIKAENIPFAEQPK